MSDARKIVDIAPINRESRSIWLMLRRDGHLLHHNAESGKSELVCRTEIRSETIKGPFAGHTLAPRLHVSPNGQFAGVVNDYGRYGQVIDLRSGSPTLMLDGGDYFCETVPFSFAFASWQGKVVVIHRTAWNRLDVSDALTGQLLTQRGPTSYGEGEQRPEHYLDYFHGALYMSPNGTRVLDDGWIWHPLGVPVVWSLNKWLSENVWESEDGESRRDICGRDWYWDRGMTWLNDDTVAIGDIGDSDLDMKEGVRIFDITSTGPAGPEWRDSWICAREIMKFEGPSGKLFSDGTWLYSSGDSGLSRWDPKSGLRTGHLENFHPTHHHLGSEEFAQISDGGIVRRATSTLS